MLYLVKIRLTSHYLGSVLDPRARIRRLKKENENILIPKQLWTQQFVEAAELLKINLPVTKIWIRRAFRAPSVRFYRRKYSRVKFENFEMISKGTVLTFEIGLGVDKKNAEKLIKTVGSFFGISEFGSKFDYGRFELEDLVEVGVSQNSTAGVGGLVSENDAGYSGVEKSSDVHSQVHRGGRAPDRKRTYLQVDQAKETTSSDLQQVN